MTMNATPDHLDDEILSALSDGAAGDVPEHAGEHLAACDHCTRRQAELRAARRALAAAVEPIDELTRRRLLAAALEAADEEPADEESPVRSGVTVLRPAGRTRWLTRHPALVGSVAAALLGLLVGVPFVVGNDGGSDRTLSAQAPAELRDESAGTFLGDLGDLSDQAALRLRLSGGELGYDTFAHSPLEPGPSPAAGAASPGAPVPSATPAGGGLAGSTARSSTPPAGPTNTGAAEKAEGGSAVADAATSDTAARDRADADACVAALLDGPARNGRLLRSGVGTYRGRPAVVASFELDGGTVAFVADRSGCAVLDRFPV